MAKESMKARERKREKLVARYAKKRAELTKILKSTDKGSQFCFRFNTAEELTQMQASLIEFGNHLLKMKDFVAECVRP